VVVLDVLADRASKMRFTDQSPAPDTLT